MFTYMHRKHMEAYSMCSGSLSRSEEEPVDLQATMNLELVENKQSTNLEEATMFVLTMRYNS